MAMYRSSHGGAATLTARPGRGDEIRIRTAIMKDTTEQGNVSESLGQVSKYERRCGTSNVFCPCAQQVGVRQE